MWAQVINMALGLWLMAAPAVLGYGRPAATVDYIVGPLVATFACIAVWEATRPIRWLNLPLGLLLMTGPWLLGYPLQAKVNSTAVGLVVAALSCVRGASRHKFDGGWSMLWRRHSPRESAAGQS
jgi:hypothetical protein